MKQIKITEAEMELMKIVWNQKEAVTTYLIQQELPSENSWKLTTILTLAKRLVDKDILQVQRIGKINYFSPKMTQEEYKNLQADVFLKDLYGGSVKSFMAALYDNNKISNQEIAELKKWLEEV